VKPSHLICLSGDKKKPTGARRANLNVTLCKRCGFSCLEFQPVSEVESTETDTLISSHSDLEKFLKISQLLALFFPTFNKLIRSFINFK